MNYHERIGLAIERAAEELPNKYEISLDIEAGAGNVSLFIPPVSDKGEGLVIDEWEDCGLAANINEAVDMAIKHHDKVNRDDKG